MAKWQSILQQHSNDIEVLSNTQVIHHNAFYDTINKITGDLILTKNENGYSDNTGAQFKSIYDYLGY